MAVERFDIVVSAKGARTVSRKIEDVGRASKKTVSAVNVLKNALTGLGIGFLALEFTKLTDTFTATQNRIRTVTDGMYQLKAVTQELFDVSMRTRLVYEDTVEVYARTALATRELGISQRQTLQFTESLNQAILLGGAQAQEARNAMIQLSQGLASGALRGDELRSVLEQLPIVADVIAKGLGVTRGELRKLGAAGKISAGIILKAFKDAREELTKRFMEIAPTIGQAFTVIKTRMVEVIGEFDRTTKASATLAKLLLKIAANMGTVARVAAATGVVLGTLLAIKGIGAVIVGISALTVAIAANPIGALVITALAAVSVLTMFSDKITMSADGLVTLRDTGVAVFQLIKEAAIPIVRYLEEGFGRAISFVIASFGDLGLTFEDIKNFAINMVNKTIGTFVGLGKASIVIFQGIKETILNALGQDTIDFIHMSYVALVGWIGDALDKIGSFADEMLKKVGAAAKEITMAAGEATGIRFEIPEIEVSEEAKSTGQKAQEAFMEGFGRDYVGDFVKVIDPALNIISERANALMDTISERSRKASTERIAQQEIERKEMEKAMAGLEIAPPAVPKGVPKELLEVLDKLNQEIELLGMSNQQRETQIKLYEIQNKLAKQGIILGEEERENIQGKLELIQALEMQVSLMEEIRGPQEDFIRQQAALNILYENGKITLWEYISTMDELKLQSLEGAEDFGAGFERGLLRIKDSLADVAGTAETLLVDAFDEAGAALTNFIRTGEADFSGLVTTILEGLAKMAMQKGFQMLFGGEGLGFGGGFDFGGAIASVFGGAFANGGRPPIGKASLVGERGPELFIPDKAGTVVPNNRIGAAPIQEQEPPKVETKIINVLDPSLIESYLSTTEGERLIINTISNNKTEVNHSLGG